MSDEKKTEENELKKLHGAVAKMLADFDKRLAMMGEKTPIKDETKKSDSKCWFCEGAGCFVCK